MKAVSVLLALCVACLGIQVARAAEAETVFVLGHNNRPSVIPYTPKLTLTQAIIDTGGFTRWGGTCVYLIRDGAIIFKTRGPSEGEKNSPDKTLLKPKDVVYIGSIAEPK